MADDGNDRFTLWFFRIVGPAVLIMGIGNIGEGLVSGTIGNLMHRGEGAAEIAYDERPQAYVGMVFMWLIAACAGAYMTWKAWLADWTA